MVSEAQKRARNAYARRNVKQLVVRFYPGEDDAALYAWIKSQPNVTVYLKGLARDDMHRQAGNGKGC
jgi:hypothetical protein